MPPNPDIPDGTLRKLGELQPLDVFIQSFPSRTVSRSVMIIPLSSPVGDPSELFLGLSKKYTAGEYTGTGKAILYTGK